MGSRLIMVSSRLTDTLSRLKLSYRKLDFDSGKVSRLDGMGSRLTVIYSRLIIKLSRLKLCSRKGYVSNKGFKSTSP